MIPSQLLKVPFVVLLNFFVICSPTLAVDSSLEIKASRGKTDKQIYTNASLQGIEQYVLTSAEVSRWLRDKYVENVDKSLVAKTIELIGKDQESPKMYRTIVSFAANPTPSTYGELHFAILKSGGKFVAATDKNMSESEYLRSYLLDQYRKQFTPDLVLRKKLFSKEYMRRRIGLLDRFERIEKIDLFREIFAEFDGKALEKKVIESAFLLFSSADQSNLDKLTAAINESGNEKAADLQAKVLAAFSEEVKLYEKKKASQDEIARTLSRLNQQCMLNMYCQINALVSNLYEEKKACVTAEVPPIIKTDSGKNRDYCGVTRIMDKDKMRRFAEYALRNPSDIIANYVVGSVFAETNNRDLGQYYFSRIAEAINIADSTGDKINTLSAIAKAHLFTGIFVFNSDFMPVTLSLLYEFDLLSPNWVDDEDYILSHQNRLMSDDLLASANAWWILGTARRDVSEHKLRRYTEDFYFLTSQKFFAADIYERVTSRAYTIARVCQRRACLSSKKKLDDINGLFGTRLGANDHINAGRLLEGFNSSYARDILMATSSIFPLVRSLDKVVDSSLAEEKGKAVWRVAGYASSASDADNEINSASVLLQLINNKEVKKSVIGYIGRAASLLDGTGVLAYMGATQECHGGDLNEVIKDRSKFQEFTGCANTNLSSAERLIKSPRLSAEHRSKLKKTFDEIVTESTAAISSLGETVKDYEEARAIQGDIQRIQNRVRAIDYEYRRVQNEYERLQNQMYEMQEKVRSLERKLASMRQATPRNEYLCTKAGRQFYSERRDVYGAYCL